MKKILICLGFTLALLGVAGFAVAKDQIIYKVKVVHGDIHLTNETGLSISLHGSGANVTNNSFSIGLKVPISGNKPGPAQAFQIYGDMYVRGLKNPVNCKFSIRLLAEDKVSIRTIEQSNKGYLYYFNSDNKPCRLPVTMTCSSSSVDLQTPKINTRISANGSSTCVE